MEAVITVGEISAVPVEHADFRLSGDGDAPVAVLHLDALATKHSAMECLLTLILVRRI
jgi:hypothetical protein